MPARAWKKFCWVVVVLANPTTFIKLDRNILSWRWYGEKTTLAVFIHFLLKANFAESKFSGHTVKRGQYAFSQRRLAKEIGLTYQELRTALNHLTETGEIAVEAFPRVTVVTVVNYDKYQSKPEKQTEPKPKKTKKQPQKEEKNKVPEIYRDMFGDDFEAYKKWREQ